MIELKGSIRVKRLSGTAMITANGKAEPTLQKKTVIPSNVQQIVEADTGYDGLKTVTVETDEFLIPENIKYGIRIFGVLGSCVGAAPPAGIPADSVILTTMEVIEEGE